MSQTIAILGRQPALGIAELESLYGADVLRLISSNIILIEKDPTQIDFARLGGSIKLARVLETIEATDWRKLAGLVVKATPRYAEELPEGKIRLGLNVYDIAVNVQELNRTGLQIKKAIKQAGRSVRVVPNSGPELNSAQTLHNQLTGPTGLEIALIKDGSTTLLTQVIAAQDINSYANRDQARPKRDTQVGMLPPKLAQIIINLSNPAAGSRLLDPFCGTGVVLQEAMLMGLQAYGTDVEPRMIEYSEANLKWLEQRFHVPAEASFAVTVGDATNFEWQKPVNTIACETYLGRPFSTEPQPDVLQQVMQDVDTIHRKFLRNVAAQTEPGFRMCIAVPAWSIRGGFKHLKVLDSLEEFGYTRMSFVHAGNQELIYHREDQIVARELVIITRK